jgi:hypothetical protein
MLMLKLNCINCLTNMTTSLVQLGLKGLHSHQFIQVKKAGMGKDLWRPWWIKIRCCWSSPVSASSSSSTSTVCELLAYLDSDNATSYGDDFDILLWWRDHKLTYPILSIMARDIMSVPVPTVSSESCFSLSGRIIEERRRLLLPENVEMLTCIKD